MKSLTNILVYSILTKYLILDSNRIRRGVAQMVARLVWDQDAAGSNPVTSTNSLSLDAIYVPAQFFYFAVSPALMAGIFFAAQTHSV